MTRSEDASLPVCGLEGEGDGTPTRNEINQFIRRALLYHVHPLKKDMALMKQSITSISESFAAHMVENAALKNQLKGAKWALWAVVAAMTALFPVALKLIHLLGKLV